MSAQRQSPINHLNEPGILCLVPALLSRRGRSTSLASGNGVIGLAVCWSVQKYCRNAFCLGQLGHMLLPEPVPCVALSTSTLSVNPTIIHFNEHRIFYVAKAQHGNSCKTRGGGCLGWDGEIVHGPENHIYFNSILIPYVRKKNPAQIAHKPRDS